MPHAPAKYQKRKRAERDPIVELQHALYKHGYLTADRALLSAVHELFKTARTTHRPVPALLLDGPPGTGKTFLAETVQQLWEARDFYTFQFTPGVTKEDLMFDLDIANIAMAQAGKWVGEFRPEHAVRPGAFARALLASQKHRTVLLLDELDKAQDKVDAFMLDYLNSCRMEAGPLGTIHGNPRNLLVFITKNNQRSITEPLMRRCIGVELRWPDAPSEAKLVRMLALRQIKQLEPAELGRASRLNLGRMADELVKYANEIRRFSQQLKKVPSTPELGSALFSCAVLPSADWGHSVYNWLLRYSSDQQVARSIWRTDATTIGRRLQEVSGVTVANHTLPF